MDREDYKNFVFKWNNKFPVDRWYRNKHHIAFLSEEHKKCSFFAELMEFEEDKAFYKLQQEKEIEKDENIYTPNIGEWMKPLPIGDTISEEDVASFEETMKQFNTTFFENNLG